MVKLMSACIIHVDIKFELLFQYMGRLRFTLANAVIMIVIALSCFLSENFALFNNNPIGGFSLAPSYLLIFTIIGLLFFYYFLEHKKNDLKFDVILLPSLLGIGALMIINIFRQGTRTVINPDVVDPIIVSFSFNDKLLAALQVIVWLSVLYAIVFVYNRYRLNKESIRWIGKIYVVIILLLSFIDFIYEFDVIADIFGGTYKGDGVQFFLGNSNVWGLLIFAGIITAIVLSYKRFSWYYFSCMLVLFTYSLFTKSATAIYISFFAINAYIFYEVLSKIKIDLKGTIKNLIIYASVVSTLVLLMFILVITKVPMFVNFWNFISSTFLTKNLFTMNLRAKIWSAVLNLVSSNPLDLILGLGHGTGSTLLRSSISFLPIKSAHNGLMEILLRYGILGLLIYISLLGLIVFAFIKHLKKKNYRFVFIYFLAFLSIMLHSITESTTIFTPNVGGLYFGFIFVLPVLNILQEKRMDALREDTLEQAVETPRNNILVVKTFIYAIPVTIIAIKMINIAYAMDAFCNILLAIIFVFSFAFVLALTNYKPLNAFNDYLLSSYQKRLGKDLRK